MDDLKLKALSNHLALDEEEAKEIENQADDLFSYGNQDWLVATDDEADAKAKEYIEDSLWAFRPSFLASHSDVDEDVFQLLSEKCEGANDAVKKLIKDFDHFVEDAIGQDGRGHFLSFYDGEENEEKVGDETFYLFRLN
jgi:hypothetical protein